MNIYRAPAARRPWRPEELFAPARLRYYSLARWALVEALKAAGKPGAVLLPEFICRDVLASLRQAGWRALFYPVGPDLAPAGELPPAQAVLAVDYFGFPQDLAPFEAYCRRSGSCLIEDNAHGLFSRDEVGRLLGTRAPLGILSLRKSLALPNGGALVLNDPNLPAPPQAPFSARGGLRYRAKRAFSRGAAVIGPVAALKALNALRTLKNGTPASDPEAEEIIPLAPEPAKMLARPLSVADPEAEAERRRALYRESGKLLAGLPARPVFAALPAQTVPYAYPFHAELKEMPRIQKALARRGLAALPWPDLPQALASGAPAHYRDVWLVHFSW